MRHIVKNDLQLYISLQKRLQQDHQQQHKHMKSAIAMCSSLVHILSLCVCVCARAHTNEHHKNSNLIIIVANRANVTYAARALCQLINGPVFVVVAFCFGFANFM